MDFSEYKNFLKIDFDDDDLFLKLTYEAAEEYISSAVTNVNKNCARYRLLLIYLGNEMYKSRAITVDGIEQKKRLVVAGMIAQLELEEN